jgi:serine/threonine protein kinase
VRSSQVPTIAADEQTAATRRNLTRRATDTPTARLSGNPPARLEDPAPTVLDRYALKRRLGSGAFGTVWSARDERLERDVAIKILPRERVIPARFEREARAAARLQHPAIVTLYEAAVDDHGAYLVSELVKGPTFDELVQSGRLSDRDILEAGLALCDALDHAHAQGVIHRDVKPSNILVHARKNAPVPAKLTDFGVARVLGGDTLTRTGDVIGTAAYMAPEQAEGREAGAEADLYSLALVLYEALTGVNPVAEAARYGRSRRLGTYLPPIRRQRRDLPRTLSAAIDQALRPRPSERGTIDHLRMALAACLEDVGEEPGVVVPAPLTLLGTKIKGTEGEFGPEWEDEARPAEREIDASGRKARSGSADWLLDRLGWRSAILLTAVVSLGVAAIGLAGAVPALIGLTGRRWWQRAGLAALALLWLGAAGPMTGHELYWQLLGVTPQAVGIGAGCWGLAAASLPWLRRLPGPALQLVAIAAWAAVTPNLLVAAHLGPLLGATLGAVIGAALAAVQPLLELISRGRLP